MVTVIDGPMDRLPGYLQAATASALLKLMSRQEALEFAIDSLQSHAFRSMGRATTEAFLEFIERHRVADAGFLGKLLETAKETRDHVDRDRSNGSLYKFEDMAYAVWKLSAGNARNLSVIRQQALDLIVEEYNYPNIYLPHEGYSEGARTHEHIDMIVMKMLEEDLTDSPAEYAELLGRLNLPLRCNRPGMRTRDYFYSRAFSAYAKII